MEDIGRIYIIRNRINDKVYIGKTIQNINPITTLFMAVGSLIQNDIK